jgi:hypothetical protein
MVRKLETYLNDETIKDLIAVHLQCMNVIRSSEDVTALSFGEVGPDGLRKLNIYFDKDTQTIFHP